MGVGFLNGFGMLMCISDAHVLGVNQPIAHTRREFVGVKAGFWNTRITSQFRTSVRRTVSVERLGSDHMFLWLEKTNVAHGFLSVIKKVTEY